MHVIEAMQLFLDSVVHDCHRGWVEVSTEGRTTVRRCEQCARINRSAVAPSREASFQ